MVQPVHRLLIGLAALLSLLAVPTAVRSDSAAPQVFTSDRYGYALAVPAGWTIAQSQCGRYMYAVSGDHNASIRGIVQTGGLTTAQIERRQEDVIALLGYPRHPFVFAETQVHGVHAEMTSNTITTDAGQVAAVLMISEERYDQLYSMVGVVHRTDTSAGKAQWAQIGRALVSITVFRPPAGAASSCPASTPTPATPAPSSTPVAAPTPSPGTTSTSTILLATTCQASPGQPDPASGFPLCLSAFQGASAAYLVTHVRGPQCLATLTYSDTNTPVVLRPHGDQYREGVGGDTIVWYWSPTDYASAGKRLVALLSCRDFENYQAVYERRRMSFSLR
jgi:hypothetical protein